jgi:hypothetical protein
MHAKFVVNPKGRRIKEPVTGKNVPEGQYYSLFAPFHDKKQRREDRRCPNDEG